MPELLLPSPPILFRQELREIESPVVKAISVLTKANHLLHLRIGEYIALIEAADMMGNDETSDQSVIDSRIEEGKAA